MALAVESAGAQLISADSRSRRHPPVSLSQRAGGAPGCSCQPQRAAASLQQLNAGLGHRGIEFEFSEPGNRLVTRVIDRDSGELIRQIPSDEVLRMAQRMDDLRGLLLQTQA